MRSGWRDGQALTCLISIHPLDPSLHVTTLGWLSLPTQSELGFSPINHLFHLFLFLCNMWDLWLTN